MRLLLFSGSQSPLAVRYPHPADSKLVLPPLVHRALHTALDAKPPSATLIPSTDTLIIPKPEALNRHTPAEYVHEDYEVTVKIQLRRAESAESYLGDIRSALEVLSSRKGLSSPEVVLVGLPEGTPSGTWNQVWRALTSETTEVKHWGTLNLGVNELQQLAEIRVPFVNELNVPDCTTLADEFTLFAKDKGIQLWPSGGGMGFDPLPSAELHNLLQEFHPVASTLVQSVDLAPLSTLLPLAEHGQAYDRSIPPGVNVSWVLTYTLLSRSRNIVKDKGYVVLADLA